MLTKSQIKMNNFEISGRIGEGAHGYVMKGVDKRTGREVALKKLIIKNLDEGIPKHIMREMLALRVLKSKYIVELYDIIPHGMGIILAMEFLPSSLYDLLKDETTISPSQIKTYMKMLLMGLKYMHNKSLMHRDIKPANLLIAANGVLKIADLGLARIFMKDQERQYSHQVATRWYRAPELLYGSRNYTPSIDMWAFGCIMAEMMKRMPLFAGETDIEQLAIVLHTLGTPNESSWPGLKNLPDFNKITFKFSPGLDWKEIVSNASPDAVDLIKSCVQYNDKNRPSAEEALEHEFFFCSPSPCSIKNMPKPKDIKTDWQSPEWDKFDEDFSDLSLKYDKGIIREINESP